LLFVDDVLGSEGPEIKSDNAAIRHPLWSFCQVFIGRSVLWCIKVLLNKVIAKLPVSHQRERIQSKDMEAAPYETPEVRT